jgi:uncharacterized membrane protein YfcA
MGSRNRPTGGPAADFLGHLTTTRGTIGHTCLPSRPRRPHEPGSTFVLGASRAVLLVIALIICMSAAAAAATGFGFNLLSAPLLTFVYPPQFVVVLTLLLGAFASGILLLRPEIRRAINWRVIRPLFLSSLAGMPIGLALLLWAHPRALKMMIAGLTALFALVMLTRFRPRLRPSRYDALAVGALSGFLSTSTSLNGPPVAFYFLARSLPKDQFRANMVVFVFLATLSSLVLLAAGGVITTFMVVLTLRLLPVLVLGVVGGFTFANKLSDRSFELTVLGFLVAVGLLGIASALR